MFSMRMGMGLGASAIAERQIEAIDFASPEFLSVVTGAGALWKTITPSLSKPTVAERIALADACVTSYNTKGYGTATKYDMGLTEDEGYHQYAYIFEPASYERTFLNVSAVHPYEAASGAGTILMMQLLAASITDANTSNAYVNYLRRNVRMIFIPMFNPYGHTVWQTSADEYESDGRYNSNGVDLNRNSDYNWNESDFRTVHGSTPFSEAEVSNFFDFLDYIGIENIDFYLDGHNNNIYDGSGGFPNYDDGKQALYAPVANYNDPYYDRVRTFIQQLLDHWTGADGQGAATLPLAAANYVVRDDFRVVAGCLGLYTAEVMGLLTIGCEHSHMHDFSKRWTSLDEHVTRDCEQKLAYLKLYEAIIGEHEATAETDWYKPVFAPAIDTMALNATTDSEDLTTVADIIALNADAAVAYTYGAGAGETDVYGIERGEGAKTILIVGVADDVTDALVIHRAIAELDKYATNTKLASLLTDCTITFVPSANPEGTSISDWAASSEDEAVALRTYAAGFDYVFAIAAHSADGNIDWSAASIPPTIGDYAFIDTQFIAATELPAVSGITGATIYLNNSAAEASYVDYRTTDHSERYGDYKYAELLKRYIMSIINGAAAWNTETLEAITDSDYTAYVAAVIADGGEISDSDLLASRIAFLKSNGLWATLQAEFSANFGVKYDESDQVIKLYSIKNAAHTAVPNGSLTPPTLYDDAVLGVKTIAYGNPSGTPTETPLEFHASGGGYARNKASNYLLNVFKPARDSETEYNIYISSNVYSTYRMTMVLRSTDKYSVQGRIIDNGAGVSNDTAGTYPTESGTWRTLEGLCDWQNGNAKLRIDGSEVVSESSLWGSDGDDATSDTDSAYCSICGSQFGPAVGHHALTGIWADILPSSDQLAANYNWVAANIFGVE